LDLGQRRRGDIVEVNLSGNAAYVRSPGRHPLEEERLGRKLTLAENREVRRGTLPPGVDIKGTACLFVGRFKPSGIFRRLVDHGAPARDTDIVVLTCYGSDLAA
jgi:hypothetical protein